MESEDIKKRIARVDYELEMSKTYDYIVDSGSLIDNVKECINIVKNCINKKI